MTLGPQDLGTPRVLHEGEFLKLLRTDHWEFVRRPNSKGACFVIAVTDADELVLVEQLRLPMRAPVIELPAGIIADSLTLVDESIEDCALRELLEETGFRGTAARQVMQAPTAAGLTSEMSYFVRITGLVREHAGGGVDDENITVHPVPRADIDRWLLQQAQRGCLIDARIYAALYLLLREP